MADTGTPTALYGVDVHAGYQAGLDIARLKAEGYSFFVTKSSEGVHIPPLNGSSAEFRRRYLSWIEQARTVGMVPGLYHWIDASAGGTEQARYFYKLVLEAGGPAGLLIQLDDEDDATYEGTKAFTLEWEQLSGGHPVLLYTGKWWWGPRGWDGASLTPYLWDSHYLTADADTISDDPAVFAARVPESWWQPGYGGWNRPTILQFTSRGDAGSLGNNVDLNVFRGSRQQLLALANGDDMALSDNDAKYLIWRVEALANMEDTIQGGPEAGVKVALTGALKQLQADVAALKTSGIDLDALAAKVADLLAARLKD